MSKEIEQALRALELCDQKIQEANLLLEYLEGWYGTQGRPSEMMVDEYGISVLYQEGKKESKTTIDAPE